MYTGGIVPSACTQSACPFLIFRYGRLVVPRLRYLERGTLFYAAETASPILLGAALMRKAILKEAFV